ncbi:general substrate transporter [Aspergillus unguis]
MKESNHPVGELAAVLPHREKPWYRTPSLLELNAYILVVSLSAMGMGFDGSMMNGLQSLDTWYSYFDNPSSALLGVTNAVMNLGPILFAGVIAWCADRFGRRSTLQIGCTLIVIATAIQTAAQNLAMFIIARLIIGVGISFCMIPAAVLITELAYPTHRGKFTSMSFTFYFLGAIISSWTTYGTFRMTTSSWTWRVPSLIQGAIPSMQFFVLFRVPESPRWLVSKGRVEHARAFFVKYHADGDEDPALVEHEMNDIQQHIRFQEGHGAVSWKQLYNTSADRKRLSLILYLSLMTQLCGNGLISYYLPLILESVGITTSRDKTLLNGILQIVSWVAAVIGSLLVDRVGRRPLWLSSISGMLASYTAWTACSAVYNQQRTSSLATGVLVLIFLFQVFYSVGITPLTQGYPVEILPFHSRQKAMAMFYIGNSCANLFNSFVSPIALDAIGWKYYVVYIAMLLQFLVVAYLFFPETRGYALETISSLIRAGDEIDGQVVEEKGGFKPEVEFVENVAKVVPTGKTDTSV